MTNLFKLAATAALLTSLTGCISINGNHSWDESSWKSDQEKNRKAISAMDVGTERSTVLMRLDTPSFSEAFVKGEDEYQVLFYRTHRNESDGETTKDETTPLIFKNDKLIGWGNDILASTR